MKLKLYSFDNGSKSSRYTILRTATLFFAALTINTHLNAQEHIDMQMVFVGSTNTTADFDIVLTNDGTTTLNFNAIVLRANNSEISTITTGGSTVTAYALNNNPDPAWSNSGNTGPSVASAIAYNPNGAALKLRESTNSTYFTPGNRPVLPTNVPVNIGRFRFEVTGGTWLPNSALGFSWHHTAGVVCESDGVLTNFNTPTNRTMGVSTLQYLNEVNLPTTSLSQEVCGSVVTSPNQLIFITEVPGATSYKIRLNGGEQEIIRPNYAFKLAQFSTINFNTEYSFDVSVEIDGNYGAYGPACILTVNHPDDTGVLGFTDNEFDSKSFTFETILAPNPFRDIIHIEVVSDDVSTPINIEVTDATGRQIETRKLNLNFESTFDIGSEYEPGMYQVNVLQNGRVSTSRIIKQ